MTLAGRILGARRGAAAYAWVVLALLAAGCDRRDDWDQPPPELPPAHPPRGAAVPFTRISSREMRITDPGVMVIRTDEAWRALWKRHAPRWAVAPEVDFAREMVAAVSVGGYSSCSSEGRFVRRVEQTADSLFVVVFHDGRGEVCDMYVEPVDLVRLSRSELPMRFVPERPGFAVPGPARWVEPEGAASGGS